jgi:hypothetical protein
MNLPGGVPNQQNLPPVNPQNQQNVGAQGNPPPLNVGQPGVAAGIQQGAAVAGQGVGNIQPPPAPVNPGLAAQMPPAAVPPVAPAPVAAPVGDWGQNRTFVTVPNPTMATIPGQVGDIGAVGLQILRILRNQTNDPQQIADVENLANILRPVVTASDATRERERTSVELQPLTKTPTTWGINTKIANIRLHHVPNYTGTSSDTIDIHSWLDRVFNTATSHQLSREATINLMIMASTGTAADYIRQMRDERRTPLEVVQALELRYGDLCLPEEAISRCGTMPRKDNEKLVDFIDRLRKMAKMATRNVLDEERRMEKTDSLIKGNIRRVLTLSLRKTLDDRMKNHLKMGWPEMSCREFEKECIELERAREERREEMAKSTKAKVNQPPPRRHVRQARINAVYEDSELSSDEDLTITDSSDEEIDEEALHWVNRMEQVKKHYANRGKKLSPQQLRTKVTNRYNKDRGRYPYNKRNQAPKAAAAAAQIQNRRGPPERLDAEIRRNILELLNLANVNKGECIQCGTPGHMLGKDECSLRNRPLTDRPCAKCGKGLHSADDCLRGFSSHFKGKAEPAAANVAQEEDEDDGDLNTE